jgi:transposase
LILRGPDKLGPRSGLRRDSIPSPRAVPLRPPQPVAPQGLRIDAEKARKVTGQRQYPREFYGMARPSFRRRKVAGGSEVGMGMDIAVLGVDLGKNVCSMVGLDGSGAVVMRRRVRRATLIALAGKLPPCIVGMEACCGAHHLGRLFMAHGHDVRLMSPEYVRLYVKAQKNDDAEGIAEAATRPTMRFVELKSQDQLDMQTLHRSRDRLVGERTALINQLRAILLERGLVAPQSKRKLEQFLAVLMDEQAGAGLSPRMILLVADARAQWRELDWRIAAFDAEFVRWAKENEDARRLTTIPGFGAIVASALVASVGRAESFERGRDLSAWLGIVPQQFTTGGKPKLLGISKRGNKYLRKQLIHGARAALAYVAERDTPMGRWADTLKQTDQPPISAQPPCERGGPYVFEAIAGANEPTRQRSGISLLASCSGELGRQFRHGDVGLLADLRQKKRLMRFELGVASTAARLGFEASPQANRLHQVHHEGNRHLEMRRSGARRMTILDKADNPLTQIKRIGLWQRESPPNRSESRITPHRNLEGYVRSWAHGLGVAEGDLT